MAANDTATSSSSKAAGSKGPSVAILGAGVSGLCMAMQLVRNGLHDFQLFEKGDDIGGTWHENRYPGVACDVPSHLYSFSFELKPDWTRTYSPGGEIKEYLRHCAEKYGLMDRVRLNTLVKEVRHNGEQWEVHCHNGEVSKWDMVVAGMGGLHLPNIPEIKGLESFAGKCFHTAEWDEKAVLKGKRVGVVGNAASAVQVVPEIVEQVASLSVFQRTPNWVLPRMDRAYSQLRKTLYRWAPPLQRMYRWLIYLLMEARRPAWQAGSPANDKLRKMAVDHIEEQVADEALRKQVTPEYSIGCKRILPTDDYLPALQHPNASLVTSGIAEVTPKGVKTEDGTEHELDVLILATGFRPFDISACIQMYGPDGTSLEEYWKKGQRAHRTLTVPGFPNLFFLMGPNSGLGHNSQIFMIETEVKYVIGCIRQMQRRGARTIAPTEEAAQQFDARVQSALEGTVWMSGCLSWYNLGKKAGAADNHILWPFSTIRYYWELRRPNLSEYELQ